MNSIDTYMVMSACILCIIHYLVLRFKSTIIFVAIRTSISDDWSSTGFMEAAVELEGNAPEAQKLREKREKERQKERAKVEKEKEYDDGNNILGIYHKFLFS